MARMPWTRPLPHTTLEQVTRDLGGEELPAPAGTSELAPEGMVGQRQEDSACHLTNHLCIAQRAAICLKNVPCFSASHRSLAFEGGGCNWLQMDSSLFSSCFLCWHISVSSTTEEANPHSLPEVMGAPESAESPRACACSGVSTTSRVCLTYGWICPWLQNILGQEKGFKACLELTASPRFPGPQSPLLSIRK